jgi:hypothetical protein
MERIKLKTLNLLNLILFLSSISILAFAEQLGKNQEKNRNQNNTNSESNTEDALQNTFFGKKYDLFLPKYDFQRPYKFRKEQYSKIMKYASDHKRKTEVPADVYIMGDDLIQEYEEAFKKEILYRIINKEVNLEEVVYDNSFDVYAYPDISAYREQKPKFLASEDYQMKNYDDLGNFLKFSHKKIEVIDK